MVVLILPASFSRKKGKASPPKLLRGRGKEWRAGGNGMDGEASAPKLLRGGGGARGRWGVESRWTRYGGEGAPTKLLRGEGQARKRRVLLSGGEGQPHQVAAGGCGGRAKREGQEPRREGLVGQCCMLGGAGQQVAAGRGLNEGPGGGGPVPPPKGQGGRARRGHRTSSCRRWISSPTHPPAAAGAAHLPPPHLSPPTCRRRCSPPGGRGSPPPAPAAPAPPPRSPSGAERRIREPGLSRVKTSKRTKAWARV